MKAFILAAGLGTRLRPWTEHHPKALVPVGGVPMLARVIGTLKEQGFDKIVVNVHHFADQITEYLRDNDFGVEILISDESGLLLDTGGAIVHAAPLLFADSESVLVHNVDILSNADLRELMVSHDRSGALATLLVSDRESSRKLIADEHWKLCGWHNEKTGKFLPSGFVETSEMRRVAFSGIHVISSDIVSRMKSRCMKGKFPIMDFYLGECSKGDIMCHHTDRLALIDIGKPESLKEANRLCGDQSV